MLNSTMQKQGCLLWIGLLFSSPVWAQASLELRGRNQPTHTVTAAEWASLPHQSLVAKDKEGKQHRYQGVPMQEMLKLLHAPQGKAIHGEALAQVLVISAKDGYQVVFALPELDPTFTTQTVLLADRRDGQPLPAESGPYQLIVPQEKRPARWVRQVTGLRITTVQP